MAWALQSWSDIPVDLAGLVLWRLYAHVDRVRFAAVCPQWRSAARQVRLPPPPPLLALKAGGTFYSMPRGEPLRFPGCDDGFLTASGNWLVYNRLHCLLLVDPFSGATMTLPAPPSFDFHDKIASMDAPYSRVFTLVKLIVCSPRLIAALFQGGSGYRVAVYRPGASSWSVALERPRERHRWIIDIAFYQDKLYGVNFVKDLFAFHISVDDSTGDPQVGRIGWVIKCGSFELDSNFRTVFYLIESGGSLLMVRRRIFLGHIHDEGQIHTFAEQCEPELVVFEADFRQSRWAKVMTLGEDQALFLGPCSRAVRMPQCDSLDNRLWFLDDYWKYQYSRLSRNSSSGTDDMATRKFSCPLPMISWSCHIGCAGAVWLFPSN